MVLVSATLIASVITTQSQFKAMRAEEFDRTVMPLVAARAADWSGGATQLREVILDRLTVGSR